MSVRIPSKSTFGMVRASDFWTLRVQASIFAPKRAQILHPSVVAAVLSHFAARYSGAIEAFPLPDNFALDVARATLRSVDSAWSISVTPTRIDSVWNHQTAMPAGSVPENVIQNCIAPLLHCIRSIDGLVIYRFALVQKRVATAERAAQALIDRFCAPELRDPTSTIAPFRNSQNFQIHNLKRHPLPDTEFEVNSWVRCKAATLKLRNTPVIECEQDINTPAEQMDGVEYSEDHASRFFEKAEHQANSILSLYFPER